MNDCEHAYIYQGIVYDFSERPIPGSGAFTVYYYDRYFCQKCLDLVDQKTSAEHDSYQPIRFNATPR